MKLKTPDFWYRKERGISAWLLLPAAAIWFMATGARRLMAAKKNPAPIPVICVGNITAGGTGKTPLVAALAEAAMARGWKPVILMRGHGGGYRDAALMVEKSITADAVGDEAVLLRKTAPVVVARDRRAGLRLIETKRPGNIIIMDDGMQNPGIAKDRVIACFNGRLGIGNGLLHPAGPLRETLAGLRHCDAITITGEDRTGLKAIVKKQFPDMPVHKITRRFKRADIEKIRKSKIVAFAGIGDGAGFFSMLEEKGIRLASRISLPDHGNLTAPMRDKLRSLAAAHGAKIVTTEKDAARLGKAIKSLRAIPIGIESSIPAALVRAVMPEFERPQT